jgi:hypothetical protein
VFLLSVSAATAQAGTANISGTVRDEESLKPIPADLVVAVQSAAQSKRRTQTDSDSVFQIWSNALPAGRFPICDRAGCGWLEARVWGTPTVVQIATGEVLTGAPIRRLEDAPVVVVEMAAQGRSLWKRGRNNQMNRVHRVTVHARLWMPNRPAAWIIGLALALMVLIASPTWAQQGWAGYPYNTAISVNWSNYVGIGTSSPAVPLDVLSSVSGIAPVYITRDVGPYPGYSWGPQSAIQIGLKNSGSASVGTGPSFLFFGENTAGAKSFLGRLTAVWEDPAAGSETGAVIFTTRANSADTTAITERMRITSGGNVGIGTTTPQYRLAVNGTMGAKEVIVTNSG